MEVQKEIKLINPDKIGIFSLSSLEKEAEVETFNATTNTHESQLDPNYKPGETKIGKPTAKSTGLPDKRFKDREIQAANPAGARGLAVVSVAIDLLIVGNNWLTSYFADDDVDLSKKHAGKASMALYDVNTALQEGLIDKKYQNVSSLSDIANVVLSGVSNSGNKEIVELGKKIYKNISQRREQFIGPVHIITGPSGVQIGTYRDPNPNYDPNYGKATVPAPAKKPATTGSGG